ncbi:MAG: site-specific integrase [Syntrophotaleaceae bacterium]
MFYKEHPNRKHGVKRDRLYVLRYTIAGRTYTETLGWASEGKTELEAENKIVEYRANHRAGSGPFCLADEREIERRAVAEEEAKSRREITVEKLIDLFIKDHSKRKKRSWEEDERALRKDLKPWSSWKVKDVTRRDAKALLDAIDGRGAPVQAFNVLTKARKMWNMAIKWEYTENNPFALLDPPRPYTPRERVLDDAEIKTFWTALESRQGLSMSPEMSRALRLILVTAQRPGEVIGMHSREIDGRWWTIPAERSKNKNAHRVYLTDLALSLIGTVPDCGFIFPSPKDDGQHMAGNALALSLRRNILGGHADKVKGAEGRNKKQAAHKAENPPPANRIGIEHFRPHDLRRSAVTGMAKLRIPREDRERVVNHSVGRLEKTYNRYDFDAEKRTALIRWAEHLEQIIHEKGAAKVVNFSDRR